MNKIANVSSIKQFITIDDDHATLFMSKVIIQRTFENISVLAYSSPQLAVDYFKNEFSLNPAETVVLLDLNMPELSGWEVLDDIFILGGDIKKFIKVIVLSSSIDPSDKQRAIDHPSVIAYLEKPLTLATLDDVLNKKADKAEKAEKAI